MRWIWNDTFRRKKAGLLNIFPATLYSSVLINLEINGLLNQVNDIFYDPFFIKFELNRTPATMPCWEVFDP